MIFNFSNNAFETAESFSLCIFLFNNYFVFIAKEKPVYKQLALGWQIAKQLARLKPLSLSKNKNYR